MNYMDIMAKSCELLACLFLAALGVIVLIKIITDKMDLEYLISEDNGHASMSRFQLLIFTFVVAISLVELVEANKANNEFPKIDSSVLTLLGISASTYAVGKGIQKSGTGQGPIAPNTPKAEPPAHSTQKRESGSETNVS